MKKTTFGDAFIINLTKPVRFYKRLENGDYDETWFPKRFLHDKKISELPISNYTINDLLVGRWFYE